MVELYPTVNTFLSDKGWLASSSAAAQRMGWNMYMSNGEKFWGTSLLVIGDFRRQHSFFVSRALVASGESVGMSPRQFQHCSVCEL